MHAGMLINFKFWKKLWAYSVTFKKQTPDTRASQHNPENNKSENNTEINCLFLVASD